MLSFRRCLVLFALFFSAVAVPAQTAAPISGQPVPSLGQLDTIMQQYMTQYNSPGANLSVSVDGRLVFARGYGYANTTTGEFVQPDSRMRLASNSKPFTAAAIYKLIEQGKLTLATKPFATILNDLTPPAGTTEDPRILNITIQNLLEHKAGYDDGAGYPFDPVNDYPTNRAAAAAAGLTGQATTPKALVSYELGVQLQHDPGTTYAYSNLGYLTLGYIIERVSGMPYATYVEQNIFPLAKMMQTLPAGNLATDKLPYEVAYYGYPGEPTGPSMVPPVGTQVPYEYGAYDLVLELANGGWTSTPMDLLRFNDTLNGQYSYNILANPPAGFTGEIPPLGQGWEYTFYGSLPGTNSLVHLNTGNTVVGRVVYSAIFNTRSGSNLEEPESDADNAIQAYVRTVKSWPTGDLFPIYATSGTACAFTLPTASAAVPMAGQSGFINLTDANYCAWTATSNASWIHITAAGPFADTGAAGYTVDASTGAARTGTVTLGGQTFTVNQAGSTTPTTLTASGTSVVNGANQTVTISGVLSPSTLNGNSTDGESVTFQNGGNTSYFCKAVLAGGKASCSFMLPAAVTTGYSASYAGDTYFSASSTQSVTVAQSSTSATFAPASLTFASTPTGLTSASQTSTFTNTGTTTLSIGLILNSGPFAQTNTCGGSVAAGVSCTFTVVYKPTTAGNSTGTIDVSDQAGDQIITLTGTATAAAPVLTLNPAALNFPSTNVNTAATPQTVTATNTGNAPLTFTNIAAISSGNTFTQTNTCTAALAPNASCVITVGFTPSGNISFTGSLAVQTNATPAQQSVALTGTGSLGPAPAATFAPASLTFANTQVGTTSGTMNVTLTNTGTAPLTLTSPSATGDFGYVGTSCGATVAANASCTFTFTFTPTATGARMGSFLLNTNAGAQIVMLTGSGSAYAVPAVTLLANPAGVTFGQSVTLSASATNVPAAGNYTYSLLDGSTVLVTSMTSAAFNYTVAAPTAGTHTYTAVLTSGANTTTYPTATSNVAMVTVAKATTSATFAMPAAITYGTPLGSAQLAASSATAGTFTYSPAAGTILTAGTQALAATLTPTDAVDYSGSSASTTIVVNKAALTVTAANATRAYGAANPVFGGMVVGALMSDGLTAAFTSSATATTAAGTTAAITPGLGDPNGRLGNYTVALVPATLTITKAGTTALFTGPASTPVGSTATLTATIASTTTGTPTGMVTFSGGAGGGTLGTATLVNGVATFSYTPPAGSTTLTLNYLGDGNFNPSTGFVTVATGIPDFSVTATPTSASVAAGTSATYTLTNAGVNGFNQTIFYSCAGLPAYTACNFVPAIVQPGQTSQLTITTTAGVFALNHQPGTGNWAARGVAGTLLAFLLGLPLLRRRNPALRRSLLSLLLLIGLAASVAGCGSNGTFANPTISTPKGTYTVTVNALTTGGTSHATSLTLTVQ